MAQTNAASIVNYDFFQAPGINNGVVTPNSNGTAAQYSVISGPGDTVMCFKFTVKRSLRTDGTTGGLRDVLYTQIGRTSVPSADIFAGSTTGRFYDIIDTMVYVYGATTGASISVPVRLIRQVTT